MLLVLLAQLLAPAPLVAQSPTPATNTEMLQELERMRARIQELEAELKARDHAQTTQPSPSAPDAKPVVVGEKPITTEAPGASSEPFAFADWTWLTGNPR